MKKIQLIAAIVLCFATIVSASVIDAPHNEANNIRCTTCHTYALWWQYSPSSQHLDPAHGAIADSVCMNCHDAGGSAPAVKTHSAAVMGSTAYHGGNWAIGCTECHDPHYQGQLNWMGSSPSPYLITGTIDSVSVDIPQVGQSTITYSGASINPEWPANGAGGDDLDWGRKNQSGRGLIFVHDSSLATNTFSIISATDSQVVVSGILDPYSVVPFILGNPASSNSFGLIYGQLINSSIVTPASGTKDVKFFSPLGGFVNLESPVSGVCQVCHAEAVHFRNTGEVNVGVVGLDHTARAALNCISCHAHTGGFAHGPGGSGSGCGTTTECHGTKGSHPPHLNPAGLVRATCAVCHDTSQFPTFADGQTTIAATSVCIPCHDNGKGVFVAPPEWGSVSPLQCSECHAAAPSTGSHSKHLATPGIACANCHNGTVQSLTAMEQHLDGNIDVYKINPGDLGYPVDKVKNSVAATCSVEACHGSGAPQWGGTVTCYTCHVGASDVDDYTYGNSVLATINEGQWLASGHGLEAGTYEVSGNPAANLAAAAGSGNVCAYCHDSTVGHGAETNPFSLANSNVLGNGANDICLICHGTAGNGYDPDDVGAMTLKSATIKIDKNHYGQKHGAGTDGGSLCWDCHDPHGDRAGGSGNIFMIQAAVVNDKADAYGRPTSTVTPVFTAHTNASDFAKTEAPFTGICQVCHTGTAYYTSSSGNNGHFTELCVNCHAHGTGEVSNQAFNHGAGLGGVDSCAACHGHDSGYEYSPGKFSQGRGSYFSHSTHTENDIDDKKGPNLTCDACHDTNNFPRFITGTDLDGDGIELSETDVCNTCHSPGGSYDGVNGLTIGVKANWDTGIYESDSVTLKGGKEKWCASCHDESPSYISGIYAPNVVGDEGGAYTYGTGWGYYKTGHGLDSATSYASSGGRVYGAGKDCAACHDLSLTHTDGNSRTYSSASNNYQTGYRLKSINGGKPMNIPQPVNIDHLDQGNYALCFSCHDSNKYLLTAPNLVTTSFRDDLDLGPWDGGTAPINIHRYHLNFNSFNYDSDWNGTTDSTVSCVNCHNVHGSTQLSMVRDGKLVGREPGMVMYYDNDLTAPTVSATNPPNPANVTLGDSTGTVFLTSSPVNICGHCHGGTWAKYYRTPPSLPAAPIMSWTGEANYAADGIDPDIGLGGDYFTFRITYSDANYQTPQIIQVWIDEDDSGTYESGEKYDMQGVDTNDIDVSNGKLYRLIRPIGHAGDGTIAYRFYASDGAFNAMGDPTHPSNNTLFVINNPPMLSWAGEFGYTDDGVNPNSAEVGSIFTLRVQYTDQDNNAPSFVRVWVDKDDDGTSVGDEATELLTMSAVDDNDTDYTNGKLYTLEVPIASAGDGTLTYSFSASDGNDTATGVPTAIWTFGVTSVNTAPELAWTGETNFVMNGVDPDSDVPDATFTFRVKYIDQDNNSPSSIQVWVDVNDNGVYEVGEKYDMAAVDAADTDFTDGRIYTRGLDIGVAGDGILNYRFHATDGVDEATGSPTEDNIVTAIIGALKVSCPGIGVYDYTSIQAAINSASDGNIILVADGTCTERITINNKDLTIKSVNGPAATIIDGSAGGIVVTLTNGADSTLNGFTIRNGYLGSGYGGGISITSSSPTIKNSIVTSNNSPRATAIYVTGSGSLVTILNSTVSNNTSAYEGPGLYLTNGTSAVITGSNFFNNTANGGFGGAICMSTSSNASLSISGSTFSANPVTSYGGGLYVAGSGGTVTVNIADTTFTGHTAQKGGGIYMTDSGATLSLSISGSTISSNTTSLEAGGLYLLSLDSVTISNSTINNNSGTAGGGFYSSGVGSLTVSDSTIRDNTASIGGGMRLSGTTVTFDRSSITGNTSAQRGAGGYISATAPTFKNCIISGNKATSFDGGGLAFDGVGVVANIVNSTFSGNLVGTTGGAIAILNSASVTVKNSILYGDGGISSSEISGTVAASYSVIGQNGYEGNNNLNINPSFIGAIAYGSAPTSSGNYHLQLTSPAIDMGTATGAPSDDIDGNLRPIGSGIDMGADEVTTTANITPTLSWTAESNYSADGVDPDMGTDSGNFVFRVGYADADNDAPSSIQVWIDTNDDGDFLDPGEKIDMTPVDGGDADYTDGRFYTNTVSISYAGDGILPYRFYAADGTVAATGSPTASKNVVVNTPPTLAWLASGNYVSDGVDPDSGGSGTAFTFQIRYADANNNGPTSLQVWVDANDNGNYLDAGEKLTMTQLDADDSVYSDGKDYSATVNLSYAGDGVLNYKFYASDGSVATGTPVTSGGTVTVTNSVPTLAWLGSGNYVSDGVNPNGAISGANSFEYRIIYTDADNQAPASIQVWIDENDNSTYEPEEKHNMNAVDGDSDYTDGKSYTYSAVNLSRVSDDYLNYRFAASDGISAATGTPVTTDTPVGLFAANQAPNLDWTAEVNYVDDGVDPNSGVGGDTFSFRVKYTDPENTAPTFIQVWIDLNNDTVEDGGELSTLVAVDAGDLSYDDGKLYSASVVIASVVNPSTTYRFKASDGTAAATGNATLLGNNVSVITPIEVCGVNDPATCKFTTISAAISAALSTPPCDTKSYIKVCNNTYNENINFNGKAITIFKESAAGTATIQGATSTTNLPVVTFSSSETASSVLDGFVIDNQFNTGNAARGIYISNSGPTIKNCVIQGNSADNGTDGGGGVYINNIIAGVAPTFDNCTIKANHAANRSGCGIYIKGAYGGATITNSTIGGTATEDGNKCTNGTGGGIYYIGSTNGTLAISNSNIQYNQGNVNGGGLYLTGITNPTTITNTTILNNYTEIANNGFGGGIHAANAPLSITGGSISSNTSGANKSGGGLYVIGSSADITGTSINSNITGSVGGGGIYFGGTTMTLAKVMIQGNSGTAGGGGGVRIASGTATITNSLITGNKIANTYNYGGGIKSAGTLYLYFSTVADNYAHGGGGLDASGTENIYNSIIWGNSDGLGTPEIRNPTDTLYLTESNGDTSFVSRSTATSTTATTNGDYHLQSNSNCIDSGDATNKPAGNDDIEGHIRPTDVAGKGDGVDDFDKGAYEWIP